MKNGPISEGEFVDLIKPTEKRRFDTYDLYLSLKHLEEMPQKVFLLEELGAVFKNFREISERQLHFSGDEIKKNPQLPNDLLIVRKGLLDYLNLLRAELICRGIDDLNNIKESFGGDYRLADLVRNGKQVEIIQEAAKTLYNHCFKALEGRVPSEADANEIRHYFIEQMNRYINFLNSINAKQVAREIEFLREVCIFGDKNYRPSGGFEDGGQDNEGEERKK